MPYIWWLCTPYNRNLCSSLGSTSKAIWVVFQPHSYRYSHIEWEQKRFFLFSKWLNYLSTRLVLNPWPPTTPFFSQGGKALWASARCPSVNIVIILWLILLSAYGSFFLSQTSRRIERWICHCTQWCRSRCGYGRVIFVHNLCHLQLLRATNSLSYGVRFMLPESGFWDVGGGDLASINGPPCEYISSLVRPVSYLHKWETLYVMVTCIHDVRMVNDYLLCSTLINLVN